MAATRGDCLLWGRWAATVGVRLTHHVVGVEDSSLKALAAVLRHTRKLIVVVAAIVAVVVDGGRAGIVVMAAVAVGVAVAIVAHCRRG